MQWPKENQSEGYDGIQARRHFVIPPRAVGASRSQNNQRRLNLEPSGFVWNSELALCNSQILISADSILDFQMDISSVLAKHWRQCAAKSVVVM
jgi:hypothetical protein